MTKDVDLEDFDDMREVSAVKDADLDDFEDISAVPTVTYGENLNQGHDMMLGDRIRLALPEMTQLKDIIDTRINPEFKAPEVQTYTVDTASIPNLRIALDNEKLAHIPVGVEDLNGRVLVKVGPCDLSGVGGHEIREHIIKNLVTQALKAKGLDATGFSFENVNVSACVGVRGRSQMAWGMFANNREKAGAHMNAYVKTSNEKGLTHWEPRQGPQRWYNDTICAMVTSTTTSLFEQRIRANTLHSSAQATTEILKHPSLVDIFDRLLAQTKERITDLVNGIKKLVGIEDEKPSTPAM